MRRNTQKGITIVALVVTIVVLLILASITIGAVTSENGILRNANDAKEQTEIAEEKEIVDRATIQAMGNNSRGNIVENELQEQLDKITGSGKTEADDVGEEFEVAFIESKRYYTVDKDGTVTGPQEIVEDKSPGDITKDENGDDLKGDEDEPYEIWCIEDLCAFSNEVNNGNLFSNKTIMLMSDLNFNSKYSYVNGNIRVDGNIPSCNSIEELQKVLTESEGFYPIGDRKKNSSIFLGTFDGNNKAMKNIYINRPDMIVGLFGTCIVQTNEVTIKNLEISGRIIGNVAGGIIGSVTVNTTQYNYIIENCVNNVNIEAKNISGGIVGSKNSSVGDLIISNCCNDGNIDGENATGGIIGNAYINVTIINCCNSKNISGKESIGGIIGYGYNTDNIAIYNSHNKGNIECEEKGGGIIGSINWGALHLENCNSFCDSS